jgi:hypothetical protein
MRKSILYTGIILLITACSKKENSVSSSNTWNFSGTTYTAATVAYINAGPEANLSASATGATSTSANGLVFTFIGPPTQSTQMLITNSSDPNTVMVSVSKLSGSTATFYTDDITNIRANVTVNNGKVGISFPGTIWLHNEADYNDSAQLSVGTITQQ